MPGCGRVPTGTSVTRGLPKRATWASSSISMTRRLCWPHFSTNWTRVGTSKLTLVMVANSASSMKALTASSCRPRRRAWWA